jgi:hypothetical protein
MLPGVDTMRKKVVESIVKKNPKIRVRNIIKGEQHATDSDE